MPYSIALSIQLLFLSSDCSFEKLRSFALLAA